MTDPTRSKPESGVAPQPGRVRSPKRGAIPSPRADIEKATPYVPDDGAQPGEPANRPAQRDRGSDPGRQGDP